MNILMVSAEMAPFAKVGGLADVTASLSRALAARGHDVRVVLPLYGHLDRRREGIRVLKKLPPLALRVGQAVHDVRIHLRGTGREAVKIYLVECPALFARDGIYDAPPGEDPDTLARACLHNQAALLLPHLLEWPVDVVHAHDAEAAPALIYRQHWYGSRGLPGAGGTVLTIHNLAHQEVHPPAGMGVLGLPPAMGAYPGLLEFHGQLNLLKAGILAADRVTTVSPNYAAETVSDAVLGCGLQGVLSGRGADYSGILNGADYDDWDPDRDQALSAPFSHSDLAGREVCRRQLTVELGLKRSLDRPLCGFVGRLVKQKGVDLLIPLFDRLVGDGFTFALLGTGDEALEAAVTEVADRHPGRIAYVGAFDEGLARRIYAGCDTFLMPSRFEPCGLGQMYALRYGAPPVVRGTGGLVDTVIDADETDGDGFVFGAARPEELLAALRRVEATWRDPEAWAKLQRRGMVRVFDWSRSAADYEAIYGQVALQP